MAPVKIAVIVFRTQSEGVLLLGEAGCALSRIAVEILCECVEGIKLAELAAQLSAERKRLKFRPGRGITHLNPTGITEGRNRSVLRPNYTGGNNSEKGTLTQVARANDWCRQIEVVVEVQTRSPNWIERGFLKCWPPATT